MSSLSAYSKPCIVRLQKSSHCVQDVQLGAEGFTHQLIPCSHSGRRTDLAADVLRPSCYMTRSFAVGDHDLRASSPSRNQLGGRVSL